MCTCPVLLCSVCFAPGSVAHARSVPGRAASGDAWLSCSEDHQETESQSSQERVPAGDPADILRSSARLPGQDEQWRPSPGNCFTCQHAACGGEYRCGLTSCRWSMWGHHLSENICNAFICVLPLIIIQLALKILKNIYLFGICWMNHSGCNEANLLLSNKDSSMSMHNKNKKKTFLQIDLN